MSADITVFKEEDSTATSLPETEEGEATSETEVDTEFKNEALHKHVNGAKAIITDEYRDRRLNAEGSPSYIPGTATAEHPISPPRKYESLISSDSTPPSTLPASGASSVNASPDTEKLKINFQDSMIAPAIDENENNQPSIQDAKIATANSVDESEPSSPQDSDIVLPSSIDENGPSLTQDFKAPLSNGEEDAKTAPGFIKNGSTPSSPVAYCVEGIQEKGFDPNRCCDDCGRPLALSISVCCCQLQQANRQCSPATTLSSADSLSSTDATTT